MEKKVKTLIDRKLAKISSDINKEWFYEFFDLFFKYGYRGEINSVVEAFFNTEEINRIEVDPPLILMNKPASKKAMKQHNLTKLALAGGVSASSYIREKFKEAFAACLNKVYADKNIVAFERGKLLFIANNSEKCEFANSCEFFKNSF